MYKRVKKSEGLVFMEKFLSYIKAKIKKIFIKLSTNMKKETWFKKHDKSTYDVKFINEKIAEFKKKKYSPEDISIFFDLDNSLCLFSSWGHEKEILPLMYNKGYFRELPCFEEAPTVLNELMKIGYNVCIISACVNSPYCKPEKMEWIEEHLPFISKDKVFLIDAGENKAEILKNNGFDLTKCILVDDYKRNISEWYEEGGIAIKKTYSNKPRPILQVNNLTELFGMLIIDLGIR